MKKHLILLLILPFTLLSQKVSETFNSTRIINGHSIETLQKRVMEFRIEHRFGDLAGSDGGVQQWFGFDNAADIRFAFEYGISDKLMIGLGRSKGTARPYRSLVDGFVKYRFLSQNKEGGTPVSIAILGTSTVTYMKSIDDPSQIAYFPLFMHRMAYCAQLNVARKMSDRISLAVMPTFVHRNYVMADDVNALFSMGFAGNFKLSKNFGLIAEYYYNVQEKGIRAENRNSLSVGVEIKTNGHNFHINLTNSKGFGETQFIPYTFEKWEKGQFRLGFSISRNFKV
jgi:hypothetical protein